MDKEVMDKEMLDCSHLAPESLATRGEPLESISGGPVDFSNLVKPPATLNFPQPPHSIPNINFEIMSGYPFQPVILVIESNVRTLRSWRT